MALHETFTDNPGLAFLLGPARPDFNLGNTWFGSVSIWSGTILNPGMNSNPVVEVAVTGIAGISHIQAEVFGTRTYDDTGLASVNVTMIEWSLPGSATVLARYTFASPIVFPLSVSRFAGIWQFTDILANGPTPQELFDDYFQNADSLIGGTAADILHGGGGNDMLDGGGGMDLLRGDAGADTFTYRSGDAVSGESVFGGSETDRIVAIGAAVTGDILQTGGVDLTTLTLNLVEELHLNGTEVAISVGAVSAGLGTFVGRTGFRDQLTITGVANGSLATLNLINWDLAQDTIAVVGTAGADNVTGSSGQDVFLGLQGADFFDGLGGDDRFVILQTDFNPLDQLTGGLGNDVLQVDSTAIATVQMTPLSDLRGLTLNGIEALDIVKGSFILDGSDFAGAVSGTIGAPIVGTLGINRVIGNGSDLAANNVLLEIQLGSLLGIDLRTTVFENWNDGFYLDKTIRIVAGAQSRLIYCPNEATWVNGSAATAGLFVFGGTASDDIYGSFQNDYIDAGEGDDYLLGLNGSDFIGTGNGTNNAWGGEGNDSLGGGTGNDMLDGENGDDLASGNGGNDTLRGQGGADRLIGGAGDDVMEGGTGGDFLWGGIGADVHIGGNDASIDFARYDDANHGNLLIRLDNSALNTGVAMGDSYIGIEGLAGGAGNDTVHGDGLANALAGMGGTDILYGHAGHDTLQGGDANDTLNGGTEDDWLAGEAGNDWLVGGAGNDLIEGGDGIDRADYTGTVAVTVDLGQATVQTTGLGNDTILNVEHVLSGSGNDTLTGSVLDNSLVAGDGNDSLTGAAGNDTVSGGSGDDWLTGGIGNDLIDGGAGLDRVAFTGAVAATVDLNLTTAQVTGHGTDMLRNIEHVSSGSGNDRLTGDAADNALTSGDGQDTLFGGAGNDTLGAGAGNDWLNGGTGNDVIDGGDGDDWAVFSGNIAVTVNLTVTTAQTTGLGADLLRKIENLSSGTGNDRLTGNAVNNSLSAGDGNDTLRGGNGNDTLDGGADADELTGGTGEDAFVFDAAFAVGVFDLITDFNVTDDILRLDNAIFTALPAGPLAATAFTANLTGAATDPADRIIYETDTGRLFYDSNGSAIGGRVHFATLTANLALTHADFLVF